MACHQAESIEELSIELSVYGHDLVFSGNVSEWASALKKMTALKKLRLEMLHVKISDKETNILRNATHASEINFEGMWDYGTLPQKTKQKKMNETYVDNNWEWTDC